MPCLHILVTGIRVCHNACQPFGVLKQGFSVALEPVLELDLVDQAGLELTEIHLSLLPEYWD